MHKFFTPKELINGDVAKIIGDDVNIYIRFLEFLKVRK